MDEHVLFSGRTAAGNPFTAHADPNLSPESRAALEAMVDAACANVDIIRANPLINLAHPQNRAARRRQRPV